MGNLRVVTTAKSGYIQRKIVKVCEDIQIKYDNTVRDSTNKIYQFAYGENGYDPLKTVLVSNQPQICDIQKLALTINNSFETGRNHIDIKKELIALIKKKVPYSQVNDTWHIEELQQRLEALNTKLSSEKKEVKEHIDDEDEDDDDEDDRKVLEVKDEEKLEEDENDDINEEQEDDEDEDEDDEDEDEDEDEDIIDDIIDDIIEEDADVYEDD